MIAADARRLLWPLRRNLPRCHHRAALRKRLARFERLPRSWRTKLHVHLLRMHLLLSVPVWVFRQPADLLLKAHVLPELGMLQRCLRTLAAIHCGKQQRPLAGRSMHRVVIAGRGELHAAPQIRLGRLALCVQKNQSRLAIDRRSRIGLHPHVTLRIHLLRRSVFAEIHDGLVRATSLGLVIQSCIHQERLVRCAQQGGVGCVDHSGLAVAAGRDVHLAVQHDHAGLRVVVGAHRGSRRAR